MCSMHLFFMVRILGVLVLSIQFQDTMIVTTKTGCMECIVREAVEMDLHSDNMNKKFSP